MHAISVRSGFDTDVFVATALVDVYSWSGHVEEACLLFADMEEEHFVVCNDCWFFQACLFL